MNKHLEGLPFYLLSLFSLLAFVQKPSIAQAIIMVGLAALCGFRYWQEQNKIPDYKLEFRSELDRLNKHYTDLKNEVSKVSLEKVAVSKQNKSGFTF